MPFLYYAGMAMDRQTEQIGLACSDDGKIFRRWNSDGLIIPIDTSLSWKSLRTCNPTVVRRGSHWLMFYQGVGPSASGNVTHAIARATSADGKAWECDAAPCLTFADLRRACASFPGPEGGVIEPALVIAPDRLEMVFVAYNGSYRNGTWLMAATSQDGIAWDIAPEPLLSGHQFGEYRIHYPQVDDAGTLWVSLIGLTNRASAIVSLRRAADGSWSPPEQVLPESPGRAIDVSPQQLVSSIGGFRPRGLDRLNHWASQLLHRGRNYWGYSHPHVIGGGDNRLYYHAYHRNGGGEMWMDIGSCALSGMRTADHTVALRPAESRSAWDAFFVADPFVVPGAA